MSGSLTTNMPIPTVPVQNQETGELNQAWYRFFLALWRRSGGQIGTLGIPGGAPGDVQFNNNGAFGGLSDVELTAHIQVFSASTSGAVPASGAATATDFLAADRTFRAATPGGPAGGDLIGTYPNPTIKANPTLAGVTVNGNGLFHLTGQTSDAGAQIATLLNAPTAGNPTFWVRLSINGTALTFPAWPA